MREKEKVMKGLKSCNTNNCGECPYAESERCQHELHEGAIAQIHTLKSHAMAQDIEDILSIIQEKNNDQFNQLIKAIGEGDYSKWESSCHKMGHLREFESLLTLISVQIHSIRLEVEEIAQQVDKI